MDQPSRPLVYVVDTTYDNRFGERKGWFQHDSRPNEPVHFGEEFRVNFQRACCRFRPQSYDANHVADGGDVVWIHIPLPWPPFPRRASDRVILGTSVRVVQIHQLVLAQAMVMLGRPSHRPIARSSCQ